MPMMKQMSARRRARTQGGSILLEVLIAILVFSFGILGIVGLQAVSIKMTNDAKDRVDASLVANQIAATLWVVDPADLPSWNGKTDAVPGLPEGVYAVSVDGSQVAITVNWKQPGGDLHEYQMLTQVRPNI
ncbi:MAG: prepilin-type cleavage/methylation domain-containing protein [Proteobacteria bacterium]|nr:prepilin-type cleavage/methylation domain-containing protein [Pseudomonadota bacterium]